MNLLNDINPDEDHLDPKGNIGVTNTIPSVIDYIQQIYDRYGSTMSNSEFSKLFHDIGKLLDILTDIELAIINHEQVVEEENRRINNNKNIDDWVNKS